jgi:glycosyltransferase involved in cell wall biosynthesis
MHILFVHKNFPAQFGHIATQLIEREGFRCTFVCELPDADLNGIQRIQYKIAGGARHENHFASRSFENSIWHTDAVLQTLKKRPDIRPDLIVGHSGFGSTLFLPELYDCPIINYFEFYYHQRDSDLDFRHEFPVREATSCRARARNAMLLLDLQNCAAGYCPTEWQKSLFPPEYQPKLRVIFDGVDVNLWGNKLVDRGQPFRMGDRQIGPETKVVTYVSRGFEAMRGFDIFMRIAKRVYSRRDDVVFVCVGSDRTCYGGELTFIKEKTYREHVLAQDDYDLNRFIFTGMLPPTDLAQLLNRSDLHIYLTVPFVLSWSMVNAMSCGCIVLASDVGPVREMIQHGKTGLLAEFYDVERFTEIALDALEHPERYESIRQAARRQIEQEYGLEVVYPRLRAFFQEIASREPAANLPSLTRKM